MKKKITFAVIITIALIGGILSCKKSSAPMEEVPNNTETITFKKTDAEIIASKGVIVGGNVKQVSKIDYNNVQLSAVRKSTQWNSLLEQNTIDAQNITKTYFTNTSMSMVTIPIINKTNTAAETYFNIYIKDDRFFITKARITTLSNGNTQGAILSTSDELYYKVEINPEHKVGHWKFGQSHIPFEKVLNTQTSSSKDKAFSEDAGGGGGSCSSKPFYECMNCLVIGVCGSDWICAALCAAALVSCLGGAAAVCVLG